MRWAPARGIGAALLALALASPAPARSATAFRMPSPETRTLENGLQVAVFPDSSLPLVQMLLLIPAGSSADPPDRAGTAYLTAEMLTRGTSSRTAAAFAAALDRLAGRVSSNTTRDYSTLAGVFLARDLEAGLEILSDAVTNPSFDEREFVRLRGQTLSTLGLIRGNPANFATERLWSLLFQGHPYASPPAGDLESLPRLDPGALRDFYTRHWRPDRATLAIAGDVTPERALAVAAEWFGRWGGDASPVDEKPFPPSASRPKGVRIRIFDAPDLGEAELRFGFATVPLGHADETPLAIASAVLGGGAASRLGALSAPGALGRRVTATHAVQGRGGAFTLALSIGSDSTGLAVRRVRDELRGFLAKPLTEAAVAPVRRVALQTLPVPYENPGTVLADWSISRRFALPEDRYAQQRERLRAVTAAEVSAAARRWIDPDRMVIVVVGPAARIRPQLEKLGSVEVIDLAQSGAATASSRPAPPATREQVARGREILRKALAAHGGLERLRGISSSVVEGDATLGAGGQVLTGRMVQIRKEPYRLRLSTSVQGVEREQTLSGNRAWSVMRGDLSGAPQDLDSVAVAGLRATFDADPPHFLVAAARPDARVASLGRRAIGELETEAVEVGLGSEREILYFDPERFTLVALDQHQEPDGSFSARRLYGDVREVQGVRWPFSEEWLLGGQSVMKLSITRVTLDGNVDDSIFEKPQPALPPPAR